MVITLKRLIRDMISKKHTVYEAMQFMLGCAPYASTILSIFHNHFNFKFKSASLEMTRYFYSVYNEKRIWVSRLLG